MAFSIRNRVGKRSSTRSLLARRQRKPAIVAMTLVALCTLTGDRAKYFSLVFARPLIHARRVSQPLEPAAALYGMEL